MPTQVVTTPSAITVANGENLALTLSYSTIDPENAPADGLSVLVHFDSSELTFVESESAALVDGAQPFATRTEEDAGQDDGDPNTDSVLPVVFADFTTANWPFIDSDVESLPVDVATLGFSPASGFDGSTVNVTLGAVQNGFDGTAGDLLDSATFLVDSPDVPNQTIDLVLDTPLVEPGSSIALSLIYDTVDVEQAAADGLSILIHFDSSQITFDSDGTDETTFADGLQPLVTRTEEDAGQDDGDPNTDSVLPVVFADFTTANWPFIDSDIDSLPVNVGTVLFTATNAFAETDVNVTLGAVQNGFDGAVGQLLDSEELPGNVPPDFDPDEFSFEVVLSTAAEGDVVGTLTATDFESDPLTFAIADGNTDVDGDGTAAFAIDGTSGQITIADLDDLADGTDFVLSATVTDPDGGSDTAAVNIDVIVQPPNTPPEFENEPFEFSLPENSAVGTVVGTLEATDADSDPLVFALTSGNDDVDGDGTAAFAIDANTGAITVSDTDDLDFETQNTFSLTATVSDGINDSVETQVTVNVLDVPEAFLEGPDDPNGLFNAIAVSGNVTINRTDSGAESESVFDNLAGFLIVDDAQGTIDGVSPGASGYGAELIDRLVATGVSFDEGETSISRTVAGGSFIMPFVAANGGGLSLSEVAAFNPNNEAAQELEDVVVYVPFASANPDGADHFRISDVNLDDNRGTFAFEDLPSNIITDNDFNDFVFTVDAD